MPELVFFRRGEEVLRLALDRARVVLGRGETSDVVIPDPVVSRKQAALSFHGEQVMLEDLSGKGTLVSGRVTERVVLCDGCDIALGQWRAIFRERTGGGIDEPTDVNGTKTEPQRLDPSLHRWHAAQVRIRQGLNETVHRLIGDSFTVGADPANDLPVPDKFISGRHLRIARKEGLFHIVDNQSTNGTFIGNIRLVEAEVPLFTSLRIGETELILEPVPSSKKESSFQGSSATTYRCGSSPS